MKKRCVSRYLTLFCLISAISSASGWVPFTAPYTLHSDPEGATVYKKGDATPLGKTPFNARMLHFDQQYELRMLNFFDEPVVVDFNARKDIYIPLRPEPVQLKTTPSALVYPMGSDNPIGKTPLKMDVFRKDRTYILKAKDYYDKQVTIGYQSKKSIAMELQRRPIITLTTAPEGVEIYENNALVATSSMTKEILVPRTFELRKEGYYKKTVKLTSVSPTPITEKLVPLPIIEIQTQPEDAEIYLVGGKSPLGKGSIRATIEQPTGFEVRANRYYPKTLTVEPKSQTVAVKLDPMPYVTLKSNPTGAKVSTNGKMIGTTPLEQLIEKKTAYKISKEEYLAKTIKVDGKKSSVMTQLEPVPVVVEEPIVAPTNQPVVVEETIEEAVAEKGMNLPVIGGIVAIVIAALLVLFMKKK